MEKKEVSINAIVKSIITGFASYGIIFYIVIAILLVVFNRITIEVPSMKVESVRIILSIVFAVFCFVLVRFVCRVSTMDVFKKCIANPESYGRIGKKMSVFYIVCIALSIFTSLTLLNLNLKYARAEIAYYKVFNSQKFSQEYVNIQEQKMNEQYNKDKNILVKTTVITQIGLVLGFLSLINYQGKMLARYNDYEKSKRVEASIDNNVIETIEKSDTEEKVEENKEESNINREEEQQSTENNDNNQ